MLCTATILSLLLFGDSRCLTGYPGSPTTGSRLAAACPTVAMQSNCRAGRGTYQPGMGTTDDPAVQLTALLAATSYDAVLIDLGVNDWHVTGITPEQVASKLIDLGRIAEDYGATPILATGWPVAEGTMAGRGAWAAEVRMRTIAAGAATGWTVVDSWDAFDERTWSTDCTWSGTAYDGVHPHTLACRQAWADYVAPRLP